MTATWVRRRHPTRGGRARRAGGRANHTRRAGAVVLASPSMQSQPTIAVLGAWNVGGRVSLVVDCVACNTCSQKGKCNVCRFQFFGNLDRQMELTLERGTMSNCLLTDIGERQRSEWLMPTFFLRQGP